KRAGFKEKPATWYQHVVSAIHPRGQRFLHDLITDGTRHLRGADFESELHPLLNKRVRVSLVDLSTAAGHATSAAVEFQRAPANREVNRFALDLIDERLGARIRPQHAA